MLDPVGGRADDPAVLHDILVGSVRHGEAGRNDKPGGTAESDVHAGIRPNPLLHAVNLAELVQKE